MQQSAIDVPFLLIFKNLYLCRYLIYTTENSNKLINVMVACIQ